jgi:hypothetical protein
MGFRGIVGSWMPGWRPHDVACELRCTVRRSMSGEYQQLGHDSSTTINKVKTCSRIHLLIVVRQTLSCSVLYMLF